MATSKHFIAYEQETWRNQNRPGIANETKRFQQVDSVVDDKTVGARHCRMLLVLDRILT